MAPRHDRARRLHPSFVAVVLALLASGPGARAEESSREAVARPRGPSEIRDDQLLAQPRLTLPATTPAVTPPGAWAASLAVLWSNSFAWSQDHSGENPKERWFLIDGDAVTVDAMVRRGLRPNLDLALRVPLRWRGGGAMDDVIDAWHRLTRLPDNKRPLFRRDAFRVEGKTTAGGAFSWNALAGGGLGDLELASRWRFHDGGGSEPSLALVGRLSLPTATPPFDGNGAGAAAQLVMSTAPGARLDLYGGFGATTQAGRELRGVEYEPSRVHGFVALEWRPARRLSLLVETDAASRLVRNVDHYPGVHWLLNVSGRIDLGRATVLDLGFTENIMNQDATTDFALRIALEVRP